MVPCTFHSRGTLLIWIIGGQGPAVLAVDVDRDCLTRTSVLKTRIYPVRTKRLVRIFKNTKRAYCR